MSRAIPIDVRKLFYFSHNTELKSVLLRLSKWIYYLIFILICHQTVIETSDMSVLDFDIAYYTFTFSE